MAQFYTYVAEDQDKPVEERSDNDDDNLLLETAEGTGS